MKKRSILGLSLVVASGVVIACSDETPIPQSTGGMAGLTAIAGASGAATSAGAPASGGAPNAAGAPAATAGTDTGGTAGAAGGAGGTCSIPSLVVFSRSDTDQSWDDNDFGDSTSVAVEGACPTIVKATWPHEAGWQNADPAEADRESTHFTLDSSMNADLTGKTLSLAIELTGEERGPTANAGSYIVSLVSVSTFDRIVQPVGTAGTGGTDGTGGAGGSGGVSGGGGVSGAASGAGGATAGAGGTPAAGASGSAGATSGTGGASGGIGGADATAGTGGAEPVIETGYAEAESAEADRKILRSVGDRATLVFALPNKTAQVDSFDPARVIKVNIRVYSAFSTGETVGTGGTGGTGTSGAAGASGSAGASGGGGGRSGAGGASAGAAGLSSGGGGTTGGGATSGGAGGASAAPVYAYLTSEFTISSFGIVEASTP